MSMVFKLPVLVIFLGFFATETSGICKWVDENGVVHYAETCPENTQTTDIQIHAAPEAEQVEATTRRSEQMQQATQSRIDRKEKEKAEKALETRGLEESHGVAIEKCAEARWNLAILRKQLPVYFDEENVLHYNRSLHDYWYGGPRTYLDDSQRQAEILHHSQVESQTCTGSETDIRKRISIYMKNRDQQICLHLKTKLQNMQQLNTGIPSDEMRELKKQIENKCE